MIETALISGAGLGGLTTAIALARRGLFVEVFEKTNAFGHIGAGIQLSPNAMVVLNKLGVEKDVLKYAFEPEFASIRHYKSGKTLFQSRLKGACLDRYNAPYIQIHRADLHDVLLQQAKELGVIVHLNSQIKGYSQTADEVKIFLANGGAFQGDLLVGADGIHSIVRTQMLGEEKLNFTGYVAWRGTIPTKDLPAGLIKPGATVWSGPNGHLVTYFIRGGALVNFVGVEKRDGWHSENWNEEGSVEELRNVFADWHPDIQTLMSAADRLFLWALYDRQELPKWSDGRTVLLGDACHPTLPFMAQGAAMAIEDAFVLAALLASKKISYRSGLLTYEKHRKPRATYLQNKARKNAKLFHLNYGPSGWISKAKMTLGSFAPNGLALKSLDEVYGYDATRVVKE